MVRTLFNMSVLVALGATQFTRILFWAHSVARLLVSWLIPPGILQTEKIDVSFMPQLKIGSSRGYEYIQLELL